jgi:hypothetical protein
LGLTRLQHCIYHQSEDSEASFSAPLKGRSHFFSSLKPNQEILNLDKYQGPRPELDPADFVVSEEVVRLLKGLDEMKSGTVRRIEVQAGLPRRMLVKAQATDRSFFGDGD